MRSILFAAIAISWGIVGCSEVPGGLPSSYQAKDFDLFLTKKAATATPIVATVHRYRGTHDSYPPDLKSFQGSLPSAVVVRQDTADDWRYSRSEGGSGFQLVIKLGWDPSLIYEASSTDSTWTFDPGDGGEPKKVKLNP